MIKALKQAETEGADRLLAEALLFLAVMRLTRQGRKQAVRDASRAADLFRELGDNDSEWRALRLPRTAEAAARLL